MLLDDEQIWIAGYYETRTTLDGSGDVPIVVGIVADALERVLAWDEIGEQDTASISARTSFRTFGYASAVRTSSTMSVGTARVFLPGTEAAHASLLLVSLHEALGRIKGRPAAIALADTVAM